MLYDQQALQLLESEARAVTFRLGKVMQPVRERLDEELDNFNLLTATAKECRQRRDLETLLLTMEAYCEALLSYNAQLVENLRCTEEALQREGGRAIYMSRQFQLIYQELLREKEASTKWLETAQQLYKKQCLLDKQEGGKSA